MWGDRATSGVTEPCPWGGGLSHVSGGQSHITGHRGHSPSRCPCRLLQGQGDLLKSAKNEALENMKQVQLACLACGLSRAPGGGAEPKGKRSLEAIAEKEGSEDGGRP